MPPRIATLVLLLALAAASGQPQPTAKIKADPQGLPLPEGAVARLGNFSLRHPDLAWVAFSPNGKRIVSASTSVFGSPSVRLWEAATGQELLTIKLPARPRPPVAALSPTGSMVAVLDNQQMTLWETATGRRRIVFG